MTPMLHVRKNVLELSQVELSVIAKTTQGTVSKWESGDLQPDRNQLALIRAEIQRREIEWDDRWFFEIPSGALREPQAARGAA